ncbi:RHS repeat-associated core domain-containing protein [Pseudomonas alloputida]|uniref:RHS repeat-associated core domain-containing protein n=1 Tax=Pseudomonas TaxID=286 RepID=UPI003EECAAEC
MNQFFYQGNRLSNDIGATRRHFLWANDTAIAQYDLSAKSVSPVRTDRVNTVLGTHKKSHQQSYAPYGMLAIDAPTSALTFAGQRFDCRSGTYPLGNGYRNYNPGLMRFTQPDAVSPFGKGGINGYAYCLGDPINRVDRNGRWPSIPTWVKKPISWVSNLFSTPSLTEDIPLVNVSSDRLEQSSPASPSVGANLNTTNSTTSNTIAPSETQSSTGTSGFESAPLQHTTQTGRPTLTSSQQAAVAALVTVNEVALALGSYGLARAIMIPTHPRLRYHRTLHENYLGPIAGVTLFTIGTASNFVALKILRSYLRASR